MPDRGPQLTPEQRVREAWDDEEAWRAAVEEVFGLDGYARVQVVAARKRSEAEARRRNATENP